MSTVNSLLAPLVKYLNDPKAIEIYVNRFEKITVEYADGSKSRDIKIPELTRKYWRNLASSIGIATDQEFSDKKPSILARIEGGHRFSLEMGPIVIDPDTRGPGICVNIRLNRLIKRSLYDFGIDNEGYKIIQEALNSHVHILVGGGTGSGKTSLTNCALELIEDDAPVVIQYADELIVERPEVKNYLISEDASGINFDYRDMMIKLQTKTPTRVVIGEINSSNVCIFSRCLNMGAAPGLATIHGDNESDCISALSQLLLLDGMSDSSATNNLSYFYNKIGLVIYVERIGEKRQVSRISQPVCDLANPSERSMNVLWSAKNVTENQKAA